jgi:hypothetical protein
MSASYTVQKAPRAPEVYEGRPRPELRGVKKAKALRKAREKAKETRASA